MTARAFLPNLFKRSRTSSGRILLLIAFVGVGTLGLVGLVAFWAGAESDSAALDRQRGLVEGRLHEQVERVARDLQQMSIGHLALVSNGATAASAAALASGRPADEADRAAPASRASVARAIGQVARAVFGYDRAYVVDAEGNLPKNADNSLQQQYRWTRPLLQPLFKAWRAQDATHSPAAAPKGGPEPSGQLPGREAAAKPRTIAELMRLEGHPAVAGLVALEDVGRPAGAASPTSSKATYLIGVRFLDGALLDDISREQGLTGARFSRSADTDEGEVAFQINATASGDPIGFIVWSPDLPGSRVIARLVPALSAAALVIAGLLGALLWRLRRTLQDLETSEHQARHLAFHDVLTGLPNRALLASELDAALAEGMRDGTRTAVALVDLDRFKAVNDTFGHGAGDELLRDAANRMAGLLRPADTLARLGGDEFAFVLRDVGAGTAVIDAVCDGIVAFLGTPFHLCGGTTTAQVGCTIGVVMASGSDQERGELMRKADLALYAAKSAGRGRWALFDPAMDKSRDGGRDGGKASEGEVHPVRPLPVHPAPQASPPRRLAVRSGA